MVRNALVRAQGYVLDLQGRIPLSPVSLAAVAMLLVSTAFRGWALSSSWFFLDDYNLLNDARAGGLSLSSLLTPYNGHFMPAARLIVLVVQVSATLNWTLAATITLVLQALAGACAWWMLTVLFGSRWLALVPLGVYLFGVLNFPAMMWWAAALNLVFIQVSFFASVGLWVRYLRTSQTRWLCATVLTVAAGFTFDVKSVLVVPVLAYLALAYFQEGSLWHRVRGLWTERRAGVVSGALVSALFIGVYVLAVPTTGRAATVAGAGRILNAMIGSSFPVALLGGPWRWTNIAPPTAFANAPDWTVHVAWVGIVATILYAVLRRTRTVRAWFLVLAYLAVLAGLVISTRGNFASAVGYEYRYLTDASCVVVLGFGLAFLDLDGAPDSSRAREDPLLRITIPPRAVVLGLVATMLMGLYSSFVYAGYWRSDNASRSYVQALRQDLRAQGRVDLVDQPVPDAVLSHLTAPDNTVRRLTNLLPAGASYPRVSDRLAVADADGHLRAAAIKLGVRSRPGPVAGCGWRVGSRGLRIPLEGKAFRYPWWIRVGYLSSSESSATVSAGGRTVTTRVQRGAGSLYAAVEGEFDAVRIDDLSPGTTLCVDVIEVGTPVAGGGLR